jgi:HAD superfamily hydrolase (TIGR01509 family)
MDLQGRFKGIIFDMDGVLIDSEPSHARAWILLLKKYNKDYSFDWYKKWIGISDALMSETIVRENELGIAAELLSNQKWGLFYELLEESPIRLYPNVFQELCGLQGFKTGLATSSPRKLATLVLTSNGLTELFDTVVTGDDVLELKPHPEIYLQSAMLLKLEPAECIAIEDTSYGIEAAKKAGMYVVAVENTCAAKTLQFADRVFATTALAISWIKQQ